MQKYFMILFTALILTACVNIGNQCVEDNVCTAAEQIMDSCADCRPDFEVTDVQLSFARDGVNGYLSQGDTQDYYVQGAKYEITFASYVASDDTYKVTVNGNMYTLTAGMPVQISEDAELTIISTVQPTITPEPKQTGEPLAPSTIDSMTIDPIPVEVPVAIEFTIYNRNGVGTLFYNYCIKNNGGAFDGNVPVRVTLYEDLDQQIEEFQTQIAFAKPISTGNYQLINTGNGLTLQAQARSGDDWDQRYCYGGGRSVQAANHYNVNINVNPEQAVEERNFDNNNAYGYVEGTPLHFPQYLVEYDIGAIHYSYSDRTSNPDFVPFVSGGTMYRAIYDNNEMNNGFSVQVYLPNVVSEADEYYNSYPGDIMQTHYGDVKVWRGYGVSTGAGTADIVGVTFRGRQGEIINTGFLIPQGSVFDPEQDPLISQYLRMYGSLNLRLGCVIDSGYACNATKGNNSVALSIRMGGVLRNATIIATCGNPNNLQGSWLVDGQTRAVSVDIGQGVAKFVLPDRTVEVALSITDQVTLEGNLVLEGRAQRIVLNLVTNTLTIIDGSQAQDIVLSGAKITSTKVAVVNGVANLVVQCTPTAQQCYSTQSGWGETYSMQGACYLEAKFRGQDTQGTFSGTGTVQTHFFAAMA
jgi:hypothetical protein